MSHITIIISKAAIPPGDSQAMAEGAPAEGSPAVEVTFTPDDGMTAAEIGTKVRKLITAIEKL